MKKILWEVRCLALLPVYRYCKKCGEKTEYVCSGRFRINAQRKHLDIWLIYKCRHCETTWNASVYSRISPQALDPEWLDGFLSNDSALAERYAMDSRFLRRSGVEVGIPLYDIAGGDLPDGETAEVEIRSRYALPVKASAIVREKLGLSQKEYVRRVSQGRITGAAGEDLQRCRLKQGITLIFS